jgi:helicase
MKIDALQRYGLSGQIIKRWGQDDIRFLLPIQTEAVTRFGLLEGKSLIVSSPGTSGKTFCGEMAALSMVSARQKAIFLVPLKAIAEEKYKTFNSRYSSLGINIRLSTKDFTDDERDISMGRFDIAICIYEKFNALTANDISIIKNSSCFIFDEFQTIADPERGIELELTVARVRAFSPSAQQLILLGGGAPSGCISKWLGIPVLEESRRPVDLRVGVLHRGNFHFRGFNDLNEGDEKWLSQLDNSGDEQLEAQTLGAILHLSGIGEQILIFMRSRKMASDLAQYLAEKIDLREAKSSIEALSESPPSVQNEILARCLRHGIAFHHADLDERQREIIETGFRKGEIRILTSTPTLSAGVNLPAKNVFLETVKYSGTKSAHSHELLVPLSGIDFNQAAGRAGRLGTKQQFGRAIMTATTPLEQEILWEKYIYAKDEELVSGLNCDNIGEFALRIITCGAAAKPDDLETICANTYGMQCQGIAGKLSKLIDDTLLYFDKSGLVEIRSWGEIKPTRLGQAAGSTGLSVRSSITISEWLLTSKTVNPLDCLIFSLGLREWALESSGHNYYGTSPLTLQMKIYEYLGEDMVYSSPMLCRTLQNLVDLKYKATLAGFLFALEWYSGRPTRDLEITFGRGAGGLKRDAATICWILRGIDKIVRALKQPEENSSEPIAGLTALIEKLQFGVDETMLPLAREIKLDREFIRRLYENGIKSPAHLYESDQGLLVSLLPKWAIEKIKIWRTKFKSSDVKTTQASDSIVCAKIIFTGNHDKFKNEVIIDGHSIFLQPRLYGYLQKIWWAYNSKSPWVNKDALDSGLNQAKYISKLRGILLENDTDLEIVSNGRGSYGLKIGAEK